MKTRHYPPSQIRYQMEHPPVTVHLSKKVKESLDKVKRDRSYAQVILEILNGMFDLEKEVKGLPASEAVISYARGFEEAEERYATHGRCSRCGSEYNYLWNDGKRDKCHHTLEGPEFSHFRDKVPITKIDETDFEKAKVKLPPLEKLPYENGRKRGYSEGYDKGYAEAEEEYGITYPCSVCGKLIEMQPGDNSHKAMIGYMKEQGWRHGDCGN